MNDYLTLLREELDKWDRHAIRGMETGATAYHQGKIALITDLRDWIAGKERNLGRDDYR